MLIAESGLVMSRQPKGYTAHSFMGIDFKEDPDCPTGMIYFMNNNYIQFASIDVRTRWQRIRDWFKKYILKKPVRCWFGMHDYYLRKCINCNAFKPPEGPWFGI